MGVEVRGKEGIGGKERKGVWRRGRGDEWGRRKKRKVLEKEEGRKRELKSRIKREAQENGEGGRRGKKK